MTTPIAFHPKLSAAERAAIQHAVDSSGTTDLSISNGSRVDDTTSPDFWRGYSSDEYPEELTDDEMLAYIAGSTPDDSYDPDAEEAALDAILAEAGIDPDAEEWDDDVDLAGSLAGSYVGTPTAGVAPYSPDQFGPKRTSLQKHLLEKHGITPGAGHDDSLKVLHASLHRNGTVRVPHAHRDLSLAMGGTAASIIDFDGGSTQSADTPGGPGHSMAHDPRLPSWEPQRRRGGDWVTTMPGIGEISRLPRSTPQQGGPMTVAERREAAGRTYVERDICGNVVGSVEAEMLELENDIYEEGGTINADEVLPSDDATYEAWVKQSARHGRSRPTW